MSDKTEEPTPKKLRKAHQDGDSGQSSYASQAVAFVAAVSLIPAATRALWEASDRGLHAAIARAAEESPRAAVDGATLAGSIVMLAAPVLLASLVAGSAASVVQTGGMIATGKLTPKLERLDVIAGFRQLWSATRLFIVARALFLASAVAYFAYRGLRAHLVDLAHLSKNLGYVGVVAGSVARDLALNAALAGIGLAVVDIVVVRRAWKRKLMMSKDEVKREHKENDGDPELKAARDRAHREMLASAAVANVRNASVVVVNPTHIACALRYDEKEGDAAPMVVASGEGDLAAQIIRAAHDYAVPVLRDVPLARALVELEVGDAIPEALYEAVAEILRDAWEDER